MYADPRKSKHGQRSRFKRYVVVYQKPLISTHTKAKSWDVKQKKKKKHKNKRRRRRISSHAFAHVDGSGYGHIQER